MYGYTLWTKIVLWSHKSTQSKQGRKIHNLSTVRYKIIISLGTGPILRRSAVGKASPKNERQQPNKKISQSEITDDVPQGIFMRKEK